MLDGLRRELAQVKSDLAWRKLRDAIAQKYSQNQPRVPAGSGRESGRWTSGGEGGSGRPRVYIYRTNPDDEGAGDGGQLDELVVDGTDWADSNPGFDRATDGSDADDLSADRNDGAIDDRASGDRRPAGITDSRVISDADPEPLRPGEQYASARGGRRGSGPGGETPAQQARLSAAQAHANDAINRVRELDPTWSPRQSVENTIEGRISPYEGEAREAQQRINDLTGVLAPGSSSGRSIFNPGRRLNAAEQRELNEIMAETGCHRCGIRNSGTSSGNAIPDHQPPTALNSAGQAQRLFPHCATCSRTQGGFVSGITGRLRR